MLDEAGAQGVVDGELVKGAVAFQDCEVRQIMTPRTRMVGIPAEPV
jgi:CBS domain containing-hemolysin-like protein